MTRYTVIVDTREQRPLPLADIIVAQELPFVVERRTMRTADYAVRGLENLILIERKSIEDLVGCIAGGRQRFEHELERMCTETLWPVLLVEGSIAAITGHCYRGRVSPNAVLGSLAAWALDHRLRVVLAGTREGAAHFVIRLFRAALRRHERGLGIHCC